MKFLDHLVVRHVNEDTWYLEKELRCIADDGEAIYVPAGFETDFASVPRGLWNLFPPTGKWGKAAVLHDWCYSDRRYSDTMPVKEARLKCDQRFLEGMRDLNVGLRRHIMFRAVRLFGRRAYVT